MKPVPPLLTILELTMIAALVTLVSPTSLEGDEKVALALGNGEVVAFVGGTDLVRMQKDGRAEAALTHRFKEAKPRFRDLAWEGDTVYLQTTVAERWRRQAFGDMKGQLKKVGATLVIAQFGKIESLDGPNRLEDFTKAYDKLIDQLADDERRVILLAPSPFQWPEVQGAAFKTYSVAIEQLAARRKISFVRDLVGKTKPSARLVAAVREKHRLWYEYWRPANWKCLFGDDSRRVFSNASRGLPSFKQEWSKYPDLIAQAEARVFAGQAPVTSEPSKLTGSKQADWKKELKAFTPLEGFEVNLFADETLGIANPLSIRWDTRGNAYVACSDVYPQIEPGALPNDKVILLRDLDADGRADKSTIYADGLNIPTGMEVGHEVVYIGQGTELLELRDRDGDGVAEERKVLLSGFGNGDSHQTINSFRWSPDGELWFCQGDGIQSRVETPHGVSSLYQAGVYRLGPNSLRLDGLLNDFMGPGNPWGVAFDDFGQSLVIDGAGGISYLTPASVPAKRRLRLPRIGQPGGYCGVACLGASNLPQDMQGEFLLGDYKRNRIGRFALVEDGAGFNVVWKEPLLRSSHRNFRPIDVKVGPDGAIYVVDWYNPITCHQDDFYRHPERDKTHGRIWRITPKTGALKPPQLVTAANEKLLDALRSKERWTRLKAKQVLATRDAKKVLPALRTWATQKGDEKEGRLLQAALTLAWMELPDAKMIHQLLQANDHRSRAYATRLLGRWGMQLEEVFELLELAAADNHPRVRMEAVLAAGQIPDPRSILVAASVAESPKDRWIDYAFSQAVHHLKPVWLPAFRGGEVDFGNRQQGMSAVLGESGARGLLGEIRNLLLSGDAEDEERLALGNALINAGGKNEIELILKLRPSSAALLQSLAKRERPELKLAELLAPLLKEKALETKAGAMDLIARWEVEELRGDAQELARKQETPDPLRLAAIRAVGSLAGPKADDILTALATDKNSRHRTPAVVALIQGNIERAAELAVNIMGDSPEKAELTHLLESFASREKGGDALAKALGKRKPNPAQTKRLREVWIATGLVNQTLADTLDELTGQTAGNGKFDDSLVDRLVREGKRGSVSRGKELFHSAQLGCVACHKVGSVGGTIGPDLSAVGSGVPPERIVTEVMWPARQVKEGYSLTRVTLKDGRVLQGYEQQARTKQVLILDDFTTGQRQSFTRDEVARTEVVGSLMPPTARILKDEKLADLLRYLFSLNGSEN
jgi:putative heme-binding domain-containing protein